MSEDKRASARILKASGKTVREIAETLGVPRSTVGILVNHCKVWRLNTWVRFPGKRSVVSVDIKDEPVN